MRRKLRSCNWMWAIVLCAVTAASPTASAQPLAEHVPDDAVVYIGWAGAGQLGDAYAASNLKGVIDAMQAQKLAADVMPQLLDLARRENPQGAAMAEAVMGLAERVWRYPTAFYFGGVVIDEIQGPMPKLAIICHAGDDAGDMADELTQMLAGSPMRVSRYGGSVVISSTMPGAIDLLNGRAQGGDGVPASLAKSEKFRAAVTHTRPDAIISVYVNVGDLVKLIDMGMAEEGVEQWPAIRDALGLSGIRAMAWSAGFDGPNFSHAAFLDAPAPRTGLAKWLEGRPIGDDTFALVPKSAAMAGAFSFDLGQLYTGVRDSVGKVDQNMLEQFDSAMLMAGGALGLDLYRDLLEPLGDQWAYFTDADVAGPGMMSIVLINTLDDAQRFEDGLMRIGQVINVWGAQLGRGGRGPNVRLRTRSVEYDGVKVHYLGTPLIAPAWCIRDGRIYIGLQPQNVAAAALHQSAGHIGDNPQFAKLRNSLRGNGPITAFEYYDLQQTIGASYQTTLMISRFATGMGDMLGLDMPPMMPPPLSKLRPYLGPSAAFAWSDDAGLHMAAHSPFPGAEIIGTEANLFVAQQALVAGILLPSMSRARAMANRTATASRMTGLYKAMVLWSLENKDKFPQDLGVLIVGDIVSPDQFFHTASRREVPADVREKGAQAVARWTIDHMDYVYVYPNDGALAGADRIILYGKVHPSDPVGIHIVFGDGHVDWYDLWEAEEMLEEQKLKLQYIEDEDGGGIFGG